MIINGKGNTTFIQKDFQIVKSKSVIKSKKSVIKNVYNYWKSLIWNERIVTVRLGYNELIGTGTGVRYKRVAYLAKFLLNF